MGGEGEEESSSGRERWKGPDWVFGFVFSWCFSELVFFLCISRSMAFFFGGCFFFFFERGKTGENKEEEGRKETKQNKKKKGKDERKRSKKNQHSTTKDPSFLHKKKALPKMTDTFLEKF